VPGKALLSLIPIALKGPYNTDRALLFQKLSIPLFFSGIRSDVHYVHHECIFILRRRDFREAKTGAIRFAAGPPRKHREFYYFILHPFGGIFISSIEWLNRYPQM